MSPVKKQRSSLCTLGLNSLAQTLVLVVTAIGFSVKIAGVIFSIGLVITLAFLLYFDGLRKHTISTRNRSKINVLLHCPLHLTIIVLLQSLRNNLVSIVSGPLDEEIVLSTDPPLSRRLETPPNTS
jgi:hypothetical protein